MSSAQYYDENADAFFSDTVSADMSVARNRFLAHVPKGGKILDAGCGSGRDIVAFSAAGFDVTGFDASTEMVKRAMEYSGQPVTHLRFDDVDWHQEFDGVWACASLLHVPAASLVSVLTRLATTLRIGGIFYGSFKYGSGEAERGGRLFTDLDDEALNTLVSNVPALTLTERWLTGDVRPDRSDTWLNFLCRKV